jgi:galactokinase/mevalonate kinase-like predicted kinase
MAIAIPEFDLEATASRTDSLTVELTSLDRNASDIFDSASRLTDDGPGGPLFLGKSVINCFLEKSQWPRDLKTFLREGCGGGIRLVTKSKAPFGSGLGTSSILSTLIWKAISELLGAPLEPKEACQRSFVMEQSLGLGSGWQDQIGGIIPGIKDIHYKPGLGTDIRSVDSHNITTSINDLGLLAHTGGTRYSGRILNEVNASIKRDTKIVKIIDELKGLCGPTIHAIRSGDYINFGEIVRRINELEQQLHQGIVPERIRSLLRQAQPWFHGAKMCGAGGEGFLAFFTKGVEEKRKLKEFLERASLKVYSLCIGKGMEIEAT